MKPERQQRLDQSLVCLACLSENRATRMKYDHQRDWWECERHGQITGEQSAHFTTLREGIDQ